jgi:ketosteroid isomerase-like protein
MSDVERHKEITRNYFAALQQGNAAGILDALDDSAQIHVIGKTLLSGTTNKQQLAGTVGMLKDVIPGGMTMTIHNLVAENDFVAAAVESYGKHVSGKIYNNHYHFLIKFRDGKIVHVTEYSDTEHVTDVLCGGQRPAA